MAELANNKLFEKIFKEVNERAFTLIKEMVEIQSSVEWGSFKPGAQEAVQKIRELISNRHLRDLTITHAMLTCLISEVEKAVLEKQTLWIMKQGEDDDGH